MPGSELRQNKATKSWVVIAPGRGKRPHDFRRQGNGQEGLPARVEDCPFCPGNEGRLAPMVWETPGGNEFGWGTRVVVNMFPALTSDEDMPIASGGFYASRPGFGRHEVIVETPYHNRPLALMTQDEMDAVVETYHRRYSELIADPRVMMAILFRNHGERAGTSLIHPHSQIIATGIVPRHIRHMEREALQYFDEWGRCVHCDILEHELMDGRRIILENEAFVAFVPFAAAVPFETWIVPRRHTPDFGLIRDTEKPALAAILHSCLERLYRKLGDPDLNFVVNTSVPPKTGTKRYHWHLQIRPRLTTTAGFEIGSGIHINPSVPEADARYLREEL